LRCDDLPNFDLWYPLGISATVYSLLTLHLALKRVAKKLRKLLGLSSEEREVKSEVEPTLMIYPIIIDRHPSYDKDVS